MKEAGERATRITQITSDFRRTSKFDGYCKSTMKMLDLATKFISGMAEEKPPFSLSLFGRSGVGKTHLSMAVYHFVFANLRAYQRQVNPTGS